MSQTEKTVSYEEKFSRTWVSRENYVFYGEELYSTFWKTRKKDLKSSIQSFYRGLLVLSSGQKFWLSFGTKGEVDQIIDVTNARFYDDVENETHLVNTAPPMVGRNIHYVKDIDRELTFKVFEILKDADIMFETKEQTLEYSPSKIVRDDIAGILTVHNKRINFPENVEVVETLDSFVLTFRHPYEELKTFIKPVILGVYLKGSDELVLDSEQLFKF